LQTIEEDFRTGPRTIGRHGREDAMPTATIEPLRDTVGAEVVGVERPDLLDDEHLPAWTLAALERSGVLVFRELHVDDATQVTFSRRLGQVVSFGDGENPE